MSSLMDIVHSITAIFTSADMITLAIIAVVVIAAGFVMQELGALLVTTIAALIVFGVALYARGVLLNGQNAAQLAETTWHGFLTLPLQTGSADAIPCAVLIGIVHVLRSMVFR